MDHCIVMIGMPGLVLFMDGWRPGEGKLLVGATASIVLELLLGGSQSTASKYYYYPLSMLVLVGGTTYVPPRPACIHTAHTAERVREEHCPSPTSS